MNFIDGTRGFEILTVIAFVVLLAASLFMFVTFYVCDSLNCKACTLANEKAPTGTKNNVLAVLNELYNDGIWPIPYIGAAILTPLCLWFLSIPITIKTFAIMFFTSFVVIYFLFSFFGHHYIRPISSYTSEYIQDQCPSTPIDENICEQEITPDISGIYEGLGITFAAPVNIF